MSLSPFFSIGLSFYFLLLLAVTAFWFLLTIEQGKRVRSGKRPEIPAPPPAPPYKPKTSLKKQPKRKSRAFKNNQATSAMSPSPEMIEAKLAAQRRANLKSRASSSTPELEDDIELFVIDDLPEENKARKNINKVNTDTLFPHDTPIKLGTSADRANKSEYLLEDLPSSSFEKSEDFNQDNCDDDFDKVEAWVNTIDLADETVAIDVNNTIDETLDYKLDNG